MSRGLSNLPKVPQPISDSGGFCLLSSGLCSDPGEGSCLPRWFTDPPASAVGGPTCHKANVSKIGVPPTHTAPQLLMEDDLGEKYC